MIRVLPATPNIELESISTRSYAEGIMPNFEKHLAIGIGVGIAAAVAYRAIWPDGERNLANLEDLLAGISICGLAAVVPDILEPALHPNHRSVFHSRACAASLCWGLSKLSTSVHPSAPALRLAITGYLSHLLADLQTPMGLPFLGGSLGVGISNDI